MEIDVLRRDRKLARIKMLSAKKVAECLGVHVRTVWRWAAAGRIPEPIQIGPKSIRWRLVDIEKFINSRKT